MRELLRRAEIAVPEGTAVLRLCREDLSFVYPGMTRYELTLEIGDRRLRLFSTNTYEYPPALAIDAEGAARRAAEHWEEALHTDPGHLPLPAFSVPVPYPSPADVLILQGSPRPDGSCAVLAEWAASAAVSAGRAVEVVFVHDLEVRPCIGCYQCYNTGGCTFDDDMTRLGPAIRAASLLVVCTPVYTNTVPAGLKAVIDRAQALRARDMLEVEGTQRRRTGVLLATAGREGTENFDCVRSVVRAFMANLGIRHRGEVLVDCMDMRRDLRTPELEQRVRATVLDALRERGHER